MSGGKKVTSGEEGGIVKVFKEGFWVIGNTLLYVV